jgi:peptide/nickel transport system substrate-binding protein
MAGVVLAGLVLAACGGGGKKPSQASTATTATPEATTTTAPATGEPVASTTTTVATGAVTPTTSGTRSTTASTAKRNAALTTPNKKVVNAPTGGITNVTAPPTTAPSKDVQPGGTITWLKSADFNNWDPVNLSAAGSADGPQDFMIYDVLLYDDNGTIIPQTAESLTSTDALVWTLKVRPNIKFSDGTPYDAAAVKFNWQRMQDPNLHGLRAAQANLIQTMDVVDPLTLKITLKAKNSVFPGAIVLMPLVGSPTAMQQMGADKFGANPVGAGPYLMKSWVRDSQMVLQRNPNYWNAPLPYIDQFIMKPIPDETQRDTTYCAGQANMTYIAAVLNADIVQKQNCGTIHPSILNGGIVLYFNTTKPPMNDARLRQAVAMAIDVNDYSKVVDNSLIPPMRSIFDPNSPFYDASITQLPYDPVKAQQLFDQVAADSGGTINIAMSTFALSNYITTAQYVQAKLQSYNHVKVTVTNEASPAHVSSCSTRAYTGICVFANFFTDPEPGFTGGYTCNSASSPTGYCNPKFDADVADNQVTLDPKQRVADIKDAQKAFYADVPSYFLEQREAWTFTAPNIQDFHFVNDGLVLIDRIWLKSH